MAIKENQQAPDFTLPSTSGNDFTLSIDQKGKPCILYFYPMDFTPGCTKQACSFRASFEAFRDSDIDVYGISQDSMKKHQEFKEKHKLPFQLLADAKGKVSQLYGASFPIFGINKRITYLVDADHKVKAAFSDLFGYESHVKAMIKELNES